MLVGVAPAGPKKLATPLGLEPGLTGPKPVVLPLHHGVATSLYYTLLLTFFNPEKHLGSFLF